MNIKAISRIVNYELCIMHYALLIMNYEDT